MKSSVSPRAIIAILLVGAVLLPVSLNAQDVLVLSNGQSREVQILGVADGRVRFKSGPAETSLPLEQVKSVQMPPPKAFDDAVNLWKSGDAAKTLPVLKPLVENFRGLPVAWAQRASAMLGTVLLESGDTPAAQAAFDAFSKAYPQAKGMADLGLARLDIENKDFVAAEAKLKPIVEQARKTLNPGTGKSSEYGQACYLMGMVLEQQGNYPEALQHYLLAVTVFYEDQAVASRAQNRADALAKEKKVMVP